MELLVAVAMSTPIWGFALQPPLAAPSIRLDSGLQSRESIAFESDPELELDKRAEAHNDTMMDWTRGMTIATMVPFATALVLGYVQFGDEYGFQPEPERTACATGRSVLGYCGAATPWPHVIAVGTTAALGLTTFILTTQVDFDRAARRDPDWRIYEVTRWLGLGLMVLQAAGGVLLANAIRLGWLDAQDDFDTMQGLAIAHLALGTVTFGVEVFNTVLIF